MNDPGNRRPWVPYRQWVRQQEAARLRVPGVFRNERARRAQELREGGRMPAYRFAVPPPHRNPQHRAAYRARYRELNPKGKFQLRAGEVQEAIDRRNLLHHKYHGIALMDKEVYEFPEDAWDEQLPNYGGRWEEFYYQGDREPPEETFKRLREEDDELANLPVLDPKKVKFIE